MAKEAKSKAPLIGPAPPNKAGGGGQYRKNGGFKQNYRAHGDGRTVRERVASGGGAGTADQKKAPPKLTPAQIKRNEREKVKALADAKKAAEHAAGAGARAEHAAIQQAKADSARLVALNWRQLGLVQKGEKPQKGMPNVGEHLTFGHGDHDRGGAVRIAVIGASKTGIKLWETKELGGSKEVSMKPADYQRLREKHAKLYH